MSVLYVLTVPFAGRKRSELVAKWLRSAGSLASLAVLNVNRCPTQSKRTKSNMARKRAHGTGAVVKQSSGIYVFYWTDANGKRCKKSLRTKNKAEAVGKAKDFEKAIQATDREEVLLQSARARKIIRSTDLPMGEVW